jgi:hypothetical protein
MGVSLKPIAAALRLRWWSTVSDQPIHLLFLAEIVHSWRLFEGAGYGEEARGGILGSAS